LWEVRLSPQLNFQVYGMVCGLSSKRSKTAWVSPHFEHGFIVFLWGSASRRSPYPDAELRTPNSKPWLPVWLFGDAGLDELGLLVALVLAVPGLFFPQLRIQMLASPDLLSSFWTCILMMRGAGLVPIDVGNVHIGGQWSTP
jgi:hypothetical protein